MKLYIVTVILLVSSLTLAFAKKGENTTCDLSLGSNAFNRDCPEDQPYCISWSNPQENKRRVVCVECMSDCDCPVGKFCSNNTITNEIGQCLSFGQEGNDCLPYSDDELANPIIPDKLKCATISTFGMKTVVDMPYHAICYNRECVWCLPEFASHDPHQHCSQAEFLGPQRVCSSNGEFVTPKAHLWQGSNFVSYPQNVWMVLCFIMTVLIFAILLLITIRAYSFPGAYQRLP